MKISKNRLKQIVEEELQREARSAAERGEEWTGSLEDHPGTRRSVMAMKLEELGEDRDSALIQILRHVPASDAELDVLDRLIEELIGERSRNWREDLGESLSFTKAKMAAVATQDAANYRDAVALRAQIEDLSAESESQAQKKLKILAQLNKIIAGLETGR